MPETTSSEVSSQSSSTGSATQRMRAWRDANRLAFAPLLFHSVCVARDKGVLREVERAGHRGLTAADCAATLKVTQYVATLLLDGCAASGAVNEQRGRYRITRLGWLVEHDPMTRANMDFSRDICDRAAVHLEAALDGGTPSGLHELVEAPTVYEGLTRLEPKALTSWLAFDHYYSDLVFAPALERVAQSKPRRLLDVGGNTGKFALLAAKHAQVTIVDHPQQIGLALENAKKAGLDARVDGVAMNLLDHARPLPQGYDVVWMSQFLCCFSLADVEHLLRRAKAALAPGGRVWINETFIDRQPNDVARDAVMATSLYFNVVANGQSCMYRFTDFAPLFERVGLQVEQQHALGTYHTLLSLEPVAVGG
jgi:ubiquinone/menaquinone biosynthesis C-methylase UbiE